MEKRFLYYGFGIVPIGLEPEDYGVDIVRNLPRAEATGSIEELYGVLSRYFYSLGFAVLNRVATIDTMQLIVRALPDE